MTSFEYKHKVGDQVRCTDVSSKGAKHLVLNKIYTVLWTSTSREFVSVNNDDGSRLFETFSVDRFIPHIPLTVDEGHFTI